MFLDTKEIYPIAVSLKHLPNFLNLQMFNESRKADNAE